MRLKSYFVHTMEEALQVAKVELGEDAMLVDSKRLQTPPEGRPRLEVIFAAPATPPPPPRVAPRSAPASGAMVAAAFGGHPATAAAPGAMTAVHPTTRAGFPAPPPLPAVTTTAAAFAANTALRSGFPAATPSAPEARISTAFPSASSPSGGSPAFHTEFPAPPPPATGTMTSPAIPFNPPSSTGFPAATPAADLRRFRGELTTLLNALSHQPCTVRLGSLSPAGSQLDSVRARLLTAEVPVPAVEEVLTVLRPALESLVLNGKATSETVTRTAIPLLAAEWTHALPVKTQGPRTIALVGPTGAGKTSAIAKLAFHLGLLTGRTVSVFSVDNLRIGASDQLAHLCSLLGVGFEAVEHCAALPARIAARQNQGVILIDTPGYGESDSDIAAETAASLRRIESLECHLTLPATLRYREMQRRLDRFSVFSPTHLLFTRLDETEYFGPAWALARACRLPVAWVSTGPGIPEDLADADALRIASAILSHAPYNAELKLSQNLASAAKAGASRI